MKKIFYSIMAAGLMLTGVSCQKVDEKITDLNAGGLIVTADIVDTDATKVSYSFEDGNPKNALKATWVVKDQIFGFDDQGNKFTYKVISVDDNGKAEFELEGQYEPGEATTLYAVYYPGKDVNNIVDNDDVKSIAVDLSEDNGILNGNAPVIMIATGTIENNKVHFFFTNQTAIVGIYKFQLTGVTEATEIKEISLNGVLRGGTIKLDNNEFKLTGAGSRGTVSVDFGEQGLMSNDEGIVDVNVGEGDKAPYFAVIPGTSRISINAKTSDGATYGIGTIDDKSLVAGTYYYLGKKLAQPATLNDVHYSLKAAFADAQAGNTIKLTADCTADGILDLSVASTEESPVYFDLNGKTLTVGQDKRIELNKGYLVIKDDSQEGTGKIVCAKSGEDAIKVKTGSSLKFVNGEVQGGDYAIYNYGGTLIIEDGTFSGGSIDAVIRTERPEDEKQKVTTTIENGNFTNSSSSSSSNKYVFSCNRTVTLTIEDGTFTTFGPTVVYDNNSNVTVNIIDGTFNNDGTDQLIQSNRSSQNVSGGKFKGKFDDKFLASGYVFSDSQDTDGYWTLKVDSGEAAAVIGSTYYATVDDAFAAAKGGETIKLLKNCTPSEKLKLGENAESSEGNPVTLDLNSKNLYCTSAGNRIELTDGMHMKIEGSGTITYNGSGTTLPDLLKLESGSSLVFESGTISGGSYAINNGGTLTIKDGTFSSSTVAAIYNTGTMTVNNGTFNSTAAHKSKGSSAAIKNVGGSLTIKAGTFTSSGYAAILNDAGTLSITDGTFSGYGTGSETSFDTVGVIKTVRPVGTATTKTTISGGEFTSTNSKSVLCCYNTVTLEVKNGESTEPEFITQGETVVFDRRGTYVTVNISGGKFTNNSGEKILNLTIDDARKWIHVTGGRFSVTSVDHIETGYSISTTPDADGYYEVKLKEQPVMQVNGVDKYSVSEALSAANSAPTDVTIKVMKEIDLVNVMEFNNEDATITLDLNGYTVKAPTLPNPKTKDTCAVSLLKGHLVICDNTDGKEGVICQTGNSYECDAISMYGGTLDINSGTVSHTQSGNTKIAINVRAIGVTGSEASTINVKGGSIIGGRAVILNSGTKDKTATLNVYNGLIEGKAGYNSDYANKTAIGFANSRGVVNIYGGTLKAYGYGVIYINWNYCYVTIKNGYLYTASNSSYIIGMLNSTNKEFKEMNFYSNKNNALNVTIPENHITDSGLETYIYKWGNPQEQPAN